MNSSFKIDFLNNLNNKKVSVAEIVKKHKLWKGSAYKSLTQINAHATNTVIPPKHILSIYKKVYDYWYRYVQKLDLGVFTAEQMVKVQTFLSMEKYRPEHMSEQMCFNFVHYDYDVLLKGTGIRPIQSQETNQPPITSKGVLPEFIHCTPFEHPAEISCRLYLNVKPENIAALSEKLVEMSYSKRLRIYFKYWTNDTRNDPFLIYTNYEQMKDLISILKQIKFENPKIFDGCEKINPLLTNIDNFIGFGEEPEYKHSSFNDERGKAIDEFTKDVVEKELVNERKRIGNYRDTIATSKGFELDIENYLIYRLEESFKQTVIQRQKDILNRKYPRHFAEYGAESVAGYIEIENKIYRTCMQELPPFVKQQIKEQAKQYLEGLKKGENRYIKPIIFPTENLNLFPSMNVEYLNRALHSKGYLEYNFSIDINMQQKLFSVFDSESRIEKVITDEGLKPYLEKYHVSSKYLSLNTETERSLTESNILV